MDFDFVAPTAEERVIEGVVVSIGVRRGPYFYEETVDCYKTVACSCPLEKYGIFETVDLEGYQVFCDVSHRKHFVLFIRVLPLSVEAFF